MRIMEEGLHNGTRADPTVGESRKGRVQRRSWRVQGKSLASPPAARCEQLPEQGHEGELGEQPTEDVSLCLVAWLWLSKACRAGESKDKLAPSGTSCLLLHLTMMAREE